MSKTSRDDEMAQLGFAIARLVHPTALRHSPVGNISKEF
jgi:hypothetical protein